MVKHNYIRRKKGVKESLPRYFLLLVFIVISLIFGILQPNFLKPANLMNLLALSGIIGVLALGNMLLMAAGEMSFSIGAQATVIGALFGRILAAENFNSMIAAVIAALAAAVGIGLILAFLTVKIGVPTFVCTLAMGTILDGFTQIFTNGSTMFSPLWPKSFTVMQYKVFDLVPVSVILFVVVAVILHLVYKKTKFGRHLYAIGSNPVCATNVGISVPKMKVAAFALSGGLCGLAGIMSASYNNSISLTIGSEYMVPAIASTMLSATFLTLGKYNVPGTVLGAVLMIVIQNGVVSAGYPIYVKDVVQGILLTIAVAIIAIIKEDGLPSVKLDS